MPESAHAVLNCRHKCRNLVQRAADCWGSRSMTTTERHFNVPAMARLSESVVFAVPLFWEGSVIVLLRTCEHMRAYT